MNLAPAANVNGPLGLSRNDRRRLIGALVPAALALVGAVVWCVFEDVAAAQHLAGVQRAHDLAVSQQAALLDTQHEVDRLRSAVTTLRASRASSLRGLIALTGFIRVMPTANVRLTSATIDPSDGSLTLAGEARSPSDIEVLLRRAGTRLAVTSISNAPGGTYSWNGTFGR